MDCQALPRGWKREETLRRAGLSAGKIEVYYYSPTGAKFRTKPQLQRYLGDAVDLTTFDFRSGRINASLLQRKGKRRNLEYGRGFRSDTSLIPPIRQTASIFKQPVTVIKTQADSKTRGDDKLKQSHQEKPKQVFWEKRLQSLKATYPGQDEDDIGTFKLPKNMTIIGPNVNEETVLRSISTALHVSSQAITGQTGSMSALEKNPGVFINPEQPLVATLAVTESDIKLQEEKVERARKNLQKAITD